MRIVNTVVLIGALALVSACASPSPGAPSYQNSAPASVTPPNATISTAINTVLAGVTASINGTRAGTKTQIRLMEGTFLMAPSLSQQCNASGSSCSVQFNESFNPPPTACTNGGSSSVSGTLIGVIQGSATSLAGNLNMSVRSTIAGCSENGWVTNSNPSFLTNGQLFISSQHTRINLTMSGGLLVTNAPGTPNGGSSCVTNGVILQWDDVTGNWANSGSIDCTPGGSFRFQ
jgi:hypothetical protein